MDKVHLLVILALIGKKHFNSHESLEVLRNNIAFMQSLYKTIETIKPFDWKKTKLELGQWVDVKDTIDQWLEAQITKIQDGKVFIHYNGWGNHWDEWIDVESPRIAPFRTYTLQYSSSRYFSPSPNIPTDSENHEIPPHNEPKLTEVSQQIFQLVTCLSKHFSEFQNLITEDSKEIENSENIKKTASQLAPLLDRTGRLLCDLAPHLSHLGDSEECKDIQITEPLTYQSERPNSNYSGQINLMANPGDISIISNLLDRVIFSDSPSLEVHIHAFVNSSNPDSPPNPSIPPPESFIPPNEVLPLQTDTEMQTELPHMCDCSTMTEDVLTHCSLGVQTIEEEKKTQSSNKQPKVRSHVGHTIIRESPKVNSGKYGMNDFKITKTKLKMGPSIRKNPDHK